MCALSAFCIFLFFLKFCYAELISRAVHHHDLLPKQHFDRLLVDDAHQLRNLSESLSGTSSIADALKDIYDALGGSRWICSPSIPTNLCGQVWNFNMINQNNLSIPCTSNWMGLTCTKNGINWSISSLTFDGNNLVGEIPFSLSALTGLRILSLKESGLYGTLPNSLWEMTTLKELYLSSDQFIGTISSSLSNLSNLKVLLISGDYLSGDIPGSIVNMRNLTSMTITSKLLSGSIPSDVHKLEKLTNLVLYSESFQGGFPSSITALTKLNSLVIFGNAISGTIPEGIHSLVLLSTLYIMSNELTGSIPSSFSLLSLQQLHISGASFTGKLFPIPMINNLNLTSLYLKCGRCIQGTFPTQLKSFTNLQSLSLVDSKISGTIPNFLSYFSNLNSFVVANNSLAGPFPTEILTLTNLRTLDLSRNNFYGSLPSSISLLKNLVALSMFQNQFEGPVPSSIGFIESLINLVLANNRFTGIIPRSLANLPQLTYLILSGNSLKGDLSGLFNPAIQSNLKFVDLSRNELTGTLPPEVFTIRGLQAFAASINCLHGFIPTEICDLQELQYLLLDGINTAPTCRSNYINLVGYKSSGYYTTNKIAGSISPCLLSLPSIKVLHLSNNGIYGSIPVPDIISPSLVNLGLGNNFLGGTIPLEIQSRKNWDYLDVSFNRLTGELYPNIVMDPTSSTFRAQVNRLSGVVPRSLLNMTHIELLLGNMFTCGIGEKASSLPSKDPVAGRYQCGSNDFNYALIPWSIACFITCLAIVIIVCDKHPLYEEAKVAWAAAYNKKSQLSSNERGLGRAENGASGYCGLPIDAKYNLQQFGEEMATFRTSVSIVTMMILAFYLPIYGALSITSWSLQNRYSYIVSVLFLSGQTAGFILWTLFFVFMFILSIVWKRRQGMIRTPPVNRHIKLVDAPEDSGLKVCLPHTTRNNNLSETSNEAGFFVSRESSASDAPLIEYDVLLPSVSNLDDSSARVSRKSLQGVVVSVDISAQPNMSKTASDNELRPGKMKPAFSFALMNSFRFNDKKSEADSNTEEQVKMPPTLYRRVSSRTAAMMKKGRAKIASLRNKAADYFARMASGQSGLSLAAYYCSFALLMITNIAAMAAVNVAFVDLSAQYEGNVWTINAVSASVSLFKSIWTWVCVPKALEIHRVLFSFMKKEGIFMRRTLLMLFIAIFNIILIPCLVVMSTSPTCFKFVFQSPQEIITSLVYTFCPKTTSGDAFAVSSCFYNNFQVSSTPPFGYSYQCGSIIVTQYSKVFVFQFLIETFGFSGLRVLSLFFRARIKRFLEDVVNPFLERIKQAFLRGRKEELTTAFSETEASTNSVKGTAERRSITGTDHSKYPPFKKDLLVVKIFTLLGIEMTFGIAYPPLALLAWLAVMFMTISTQLSLAFDWRDALTNDNVLVMKITKAYCKDIRSLFWQSSLCLLPLAFAFYSIFIFDIFGSMRHIWAPITMMIVPALACYLLLMESYVMFRVHSILRHEDKYRLQKDFILHEQLALLNKREVDDSDGILPRTAPQRGSMRGSDTFRASLFVEDDDDGDSVIALSEIYDSLDELQAPIDDRLSVVAEYQQSRGLSTQSRQFDV